MGEPSPLRSEGAQLVAVLDALERQSRVKEFSGWDSGFENLNRALDGIQPGLYWLIGVPGIGKTSFARQMLDQIAQKNFQPAIFFSFTDSIDQLRIKTLARLSGMDSREIRRGSAYMLHWYGVPKAHYSDADNLSPSWEKLRRSAEDAKAWLDAVYLVQCEQNTTLAAIEAQIRQLAAPPFVVIDDSQRLGKVDTPIESRLPLVAEQLQELAVKLKLPLLATWPDLGAQESRKAQVWTDVIPYADAVMVLQQNDARSQPTMQPARSLILNLVKNRGGERGQLALNFQPAFERFTEVV